MVRMMRKMSYRNTTLFAIAVSLAVLSMFTEDTWSVMFLKAAGGLAIFLFALVVMEESLDTVAGDRTKYWIRKFTSERFFGLPGMFTGISVTALVQSSSVVTSISLLQSLMSPQTVLHS